MGEQYQAYRKGFVLGLTMAEVSLLIAFILLLLLSLGFSRRDAQIRELKSRNPISAIQLAALREKAALIDAVVAEVGQKDRPIDDKFRELILQIARAAKSSEGTSALAAMESERLRQKNISEQLAKELVAVQGKSGQEIASSIADKTEQVENMRGQVRALQSQLLDSGLGRVLPSCWTVADGQIDFILSVDLTSQGIRAKEIAGASRLEERQRLPMALMNPARFQSVGEFLGATRRLFDLSVERNCRFYVYVYDSTGAQQKDLYKKLLQAVEGHFYKRESRNAAPF